MAEKKVKVKLKRSSETGQVISAKKEKKRRIESVRDAEPDERKKPRIEGGITEIPQKSAPAEATDTGHVDSTAKEVPVGVNTKEKRGKKRRRKATVDEEALPEAERRRREEQRALRIRAMEMRAEGKVYKRPSKRPATESAKRAVANPAAKIQNEVKYQAEEGSKPESPVQVIVVPIFWNRKPEEKASVIEASNCIVDLLKAAAIVCGIDTTNALSPGQKFAFWEKEGVKVRIECGPRDAAQGTCMLAVSKKAGELAQKQSLQVGQSLVLKTKLALGMEVKVASEDVDMDGVQLQTTSQSKKRQSRSGDDLGGDFSDFNLADAAPKKKAKR